MEPQEREEFGPGPETWAFIALAALPLLVTRDLAWGVGILVAVAYGVRSFRLTFSAEGLRYRSPLGRRATIPWERVTMVRTGTHWGRKRAYPMFFTEIHLQGEDRPLIVNIKFFSRKALRRLGELLVRNCPGADLDQATRGLAQDQFPSIVRSR